MRKSTTGTKKKPNSCEIQQLSSMLASDAWSYSSTSQLKKILDSASLLHIWVLPPFGVISDETHIYSYMYIFILIFYLYTSSCIYFPENMLDLVAIWNNSSCKIYTKISNFLAKKKKKCLSSSLCPLSMLCYELLLVPFFPFIGWTQNVSSLPESQ